jgi:MoaD family protein
VSLAVTVQYYNIFRRAAGFDQQEVHLPGGASVRHALDRLAATAAPTLRELLFTPEGEIVSHVVIFRNGKLVPHDQLHTELADGDQLKLFPAVSGG